MSASLLFILMSVIYISHDLHPKARQLTALVCLVVAVVAALLGK